MKKIVFSLFAFLMLNSSLSQAGENGGAITVGDGGVALSCQVSTFRTRTLLLDKLEQDINLGVKPYTLGDDSLSVRDKIKIGYDRMVSRFQLTDDELARVRRVGDIILRFPFDPFNEPIGSYYSYFLNIHQFRTYQSVVDYADQNKCSFEAVIVKPLHDGPSADIYRSLCSSSFAEFEYCFLTNLRQWRNLDRDEQACLIVHESLRYLPSRIRIGSGSTDERSLRALAADICTEVETP